MIYPTQLYDRLCFLFEVLEKLPEYIHQRCFLIGEMYSLEDIMGATYKNPSYLMVEMHDYPTLKQMVHRTTDTSTCYQTRQYSLLWSDRYPSIENHDLEVTTLLHKNTGAPVSPDAIEDALVYMELFMNEKVHAMTTLFPMEQYDLVDIYRISHHRSNRYGLYPHMEYHITFDMLQEIYGIYKNAFVSLDGRETVMTPSFRFFRPTAFWTRLECKSVMKKLNRFFTKTIGLSFASCYAGTSKFHVPGCDAFPYAIITHRIQSGQINPFTQDVYRVLMGTGGVDNLTEIFIHGDQREEQFFQRIYTIYLVSAYKVNGRRRVFKRSFGNNSLDISFHFVAVEKLTQVLEDMISEASVLTIEDHLFMNGPDYVHQVLEMYKQLPQAPTYRIDHDWLRKQFHDYFIPIDLTVTRLS